MRQSVHPQINMVALSNWVQPREGELVQARRHRTTARLRLASIFDISKALPIGSHTRDTAIRWYSDLDLLIVLRRNEAKWAGSIVSSYTVLNKVREELEARYSHTEIRRDQQAVVVDFAQGQQSLDVVPALFSRWEGMRPVYVIPDGSGGWIETSPERHDLHFKYANERSRSKLRKVSQLMKWWKFSRATPIPIQSFHVDMLLAESNLCVGVKPYTHCMYQAFKLLADRKCCGLRDSCGIAGTIYATQTKAQLTAVNTAVRYALDHAEAALAAEAVRNFQEANRQWSIVFNDEY